MPLSTVTKTWVGQLNADRTWIVWNPESQLRFRVQEEWGGRRWGIEPVISSDSRETR